MTRFFICLLLFFFVCPVITTAVAQEVPSIGPRSAAPRTPTEAEIEEGRGIYATCTREQALRETYDCQCVAVNFLIKRVELGPKADRQNLFIDSRKTCVNIAAIAGKYYSRCMEWASGTRSDYDAYCTCYANEYAKMFSVNPSINRSVREAQRTSAMNKCNVVRGFRERLQQSQVLQELKRSGEFEQLFPGSKDLKPAPYNTEWPDGIPNPVTKLPGNSFKTAPVTPGQSPQ